ncbi:MAG: DUF1837 domain-containing protein [Planctomycetes bacterium]|nr:DUF1837 domain-containing protein [Planctomycetota bacterium]
MSIIKHFEIDETIYQIYSLRDEDLDDFLNKLPVKFRRCYIADRELEDLSKKNGESKDDILRKYILPDVGNIMSGDFGEMLSYFLVIDKYKKESLTIEGPRKWRWKPTRNKPAPCSDAVLFHFHKKDKSSKKDKMISIESKMKATPSKRHRIQDAIDGAQEDRNSRAVKTLNWLYEKYGRIGKINAQQKIQRFRNPSKFGTFEKIYKAIAIIEKKLLSDELKKKVVSDDGIRILVISTSNLKDIYQITFSNIISSVE